MKNIAIAIVIGASLMTAAACGDKDAPKPSTARADAKPTPSAPANAPPTVKNQAPAPSQRPAGRPQERDANLLHTMR